MSSLKFSDKHIDPIKLVVNRDINWREKTGYDVPSMVQDITRDGRITESVHVLDPKDCERLQLAENTVLRGNRRTDAAHAILADKNSPAGLVEALRKTPVKFVSGFEDLKAVEDYMLDHGSAKPLSRTEVVHAVWRLAANMHSESEIGERLYHLLARYTGNVKKAQEMSSMTDRQARRAAIGKWLHGTLGNFLLAVNGMGEALRSQLTLTSHKEDGVLTQDEAGLFVLQVTRGRVTELSAAKTKDKDAKGWNPLEKVDVVKDGDGKIVTIKCKGGGEEFNAKVETFIREDAGESNGNKPRPTSKTLEALADASKSKVARGVFLASAGKKADNLLDLDAEAYRCERVCELLKEAADRLTASGEHKIEVTSSQLADLFNKLSVSSATVVEAALKTVS
jgi:hypothetical protein